MSTIESGSVAAATYRAMAESESEYRLLSIRLQAQRNALLAAAKQMRSELEERGTCTNDALNRLRQAIAICEKP